MRMDDSSDSGHSSSPGSPVIGQTDNVRRPVIRAVGVASEPDPCPGGAPLFGGAVHHPFAAAHAGTDAPHTRLSQLAAVRHLLLDVGQGLDTIESATVVRLSDNGSNGGNYKLRQDATRRMLALHDYIERNGERMENSWREGVENLLCSVHRHIGHLPAPVQTNVPAHSDPSRLCRGHHLFHAQLEVRLLSVACLRLLAQLGPADQQQQVPWLAEQPATLRWLAAAHHLMWELTALAARRCAQLAGSELHGRGALGCGCEKGAWLSLQRLLDTGCCRPAAASTAHGAPTAFWVQVNILLDHIRSLDSLPVERPTAEECQPFTDVTFGPPEVVWTRTPELIAWMLCALSDLFRYDMSDHYRQEDLCSGNVEQLLSVLSAEDVTTFSRDGRLATLVSLSGQLARLWGPSTALSMRLWQIMSQRLVKVQEPASLSRFTSTIPGGGREWADSVLHSSGPAADSFSEYVRQLPALLNADGWRQLRGRVLLRLHPKLAEQLPAPQLAAACCLLLQLLYTVHDPQLLSKFMSFLSRAGETSSHQVLVCRALFAAIHVLMELGRDITEAALPAAALADREMRALVDSRPASQPLVAAYVQEVGDVFRRSATLDTSQYQLITGSWRPYLACCGPAERSRTLSVLLHLCQKLLTLQQQLQSVLALVHTDVVRQREQQGQLVERLRLLVPWVLAEARAPAPPPELAPLAATLTLMPTTDCQLQQCTASTVSTNFCAAYLTHLLRLHYTAVETDTDRLAALWFRCLAGAADAAELTALTTEVAARCPLVPDISPVTGGGSRQMAVEFVNKLHSMAQQSAAGCERANRALSGLEFIESCLRNTPSAVVTSQLYLVLGLVVQKLAPVLEHRKLVYIFNKLVLPPGVYSCERPLTSQVQTAVQRTLALFLAGVAGTDFLKHPFYRRCVRDVLTCYVHRFPSGTHPVVECLNNMDVAATFQSFVISLVPEIFFAKTSEKWHNHLTPALQLLVDVSSSCPSPLRAVARQQCLSPLLELLLTLEEPHAKRTATELLKLFCAVRTDAERAALSSAVERMVERHLAFSGARLFRLLEVVAVLAPHVLRALVPALQRHVHTVEVRRGAGRDRSLRAGLQQIQLRLGMH